MYNEFTLQLIILCSGTLSIMTLCCNNIMSIYGASLPRLSWKKRPLNECSVVAVVTHYLSWKFITLIIFCCFGNPATRYASQHIWCLSQATINWEGCARKGIRHETGVDGRGGGTN